ncbi:hypothetical protein PVAND_013675 [Polypedilum vanderplanki]|uniref:Biotin carboxylase-like N-terminal domain-containing protein n=1 Tax=Polypedilum vanderplanki TaxID=319348 RepID=A0A9J6CQF0_POLVA|nr:hypothetical protein PVAND_013675 [Polypedilum vanderplanki]
MLSKAKFLTKLSQHAFIRSLPVKLNAEIKPIKNLLIENRGLISVPLIKICKKFGIRTVSVYSDSNIKSLHASMTLPENNENGIHKFTILMKEAKKIRSLLMKEVRREESGGGESEKRFNPTLIYLALYAIFVQWIAFLHASGIIFGNERTEKYFDLMGSITFISTLLLSIYLSPRALSLRQIILSSFVTLWTLRLGSFLFYRIHNNDGTDSRFTEIKKNNNEFLMVWSLQGVWVF